MKNPYNILEVSQNATKKEIILGKMRAMKKKEFSLQEIQIAEKQLLNPSKRLIADYMYPSKIQSKRPKLIKVNIKPNMVNLNNIDENSFDSIK
jgi:hypothetical protein